VSEDSGTTPAPYVLDVSVLTAITRGDYGIMTFIQGLDASGQPLVIPALAIVAASLDLRSDDTEAILHGLERLGSAMIAPLRDAEQAVRLAAVIARTGLDPWDAHVAAVADAAVCPVLTLGAARWREHAADLDEPLHVIEIADPDEAPGGPGQGALGARSDTRPRHLAAGLACLPVTEAAPARGISPGGRPTGPGGGHTAPACPVPPLCAGYAVGQPASRLVCGLESAAMTP
jgi:predicted nucleic acid-binding protein